MESSERIRIFFTDNLIKEEHKFNVCNIKNISDDIVLVLYLSLHIRCTRASYSIWCDVSDSSNKNILLDYKYMMQVAYV